LVYPIIRYATNGVTPLATELTIGLVNEAVA
jgi:hypothetical protein